jgi:hypothetical protein
MVYNSIPHVHTGQTPNFMIFGMELAMPGWQKYQRAPSEKEVRKLNLETEKQLQCVRMQLTQERLQSAKEGVLVAPGDWVVYHLSSYEKGVLESRDLSEKSKATWSLPARVVEVHDKVCKVLPWGAGATRRQVPLTHVKKLEGTIPAVLVAANVQLLEKIQPRTIRHWSLRDQGGPPAPVTWTDQLKGQAPDGPGTPGEEAARKRPRDH